MKYYKDVNLWSLYGEKLQVSENNDHLGLVFSGLNEELKNIDKNIKSARDALFSLLGSIFSYKCKLSPTVQQHTWSTFIKPVLLSGLAALPIRPATMKPLIGIHHKMLRAVLKLSPYSPVAPLYFLLGEFTDRRLSIYGCAITILEHLDQPPDQGLFCVAVSP